MPQMMKDFARGLLFAMPVLAVAALGMREWLHLRDANHQLDAQRLEAVRARDAAEQKLTAIQRLGDDALAGRLRRAADAAESQGAAEERLTRVIDFLKHEVTTAESTIRDLQAQPATKTMPPADRMGQLLAEISRLNADLEALREDRDRWKKAAQAR